jgi:cell division protein FtsL
MSPRRIDYSQPQSDGRGTRSRKKNRTPREHGWARKSDASGRPAAAAAPLRRERPATGMPLLLFTALLIMTFVGIARVKARIGVLALADEIATLTKERDQLLDRKRRLEAERAYLRHPEHVRARATEELGMVPATPERIQTIQLIEESKEQ